MKLYLLFPTEVWEEENNQIDNKKLSEIILEKEKDEPTVQFSNSGGWHSKDNLNEDKNFEEVLKFVQNSFYTICEHNNYVRGIKIIMYNMWAIVNRYKDFNLPHTHGGALWSFVYYVKVPEESGKLVFVDPRIRKTMSQDRTFIENHNNPFSHELSDIEPQEGKLVIFPSYIEHYIKPNLTKEPRISISGNILLEI